MQDLLVDPEAVHRYIKLNARINMLIMTALTCRCLAGTMLILSTFISDMFFPQKSEITVLCKVC